MAEIMAWVPLAFGAVLAVRTGDPAPSFFGLAVTISLWLVIWGSEARRKVR